MLNDTELRTRDLECNELFRRLDAMKAQGLDKSENWEYMQLLYTLRDATRARVAAAGVQP